MGSDIIAALGALSSFLGFAKPSSDRQDDLYYEAVEKLSIAVTETESYYHKREDLAETEYKLNHVWNSASIALRKAGYSELAEKARIKGGYWLQPEIWTQQEVQERDIQLTSMREKLEAALKN
ncbi:hypothetical protein [Vibrio vulnificus]|uniref:hypothetical protein n=1 Tax=Vibrio vulnificus TaxID=672 RepID=UPI001A240052|nr:hypothetical protein [Vibrio vulnificus]EMB9232396.1 hypothetical protein [Vibrio harveyi]EIF5019848.1 hypothetical protein [Vibrio vulnificus]EIO2325228.1 hypothetical protein [Vibrio vulnificus]EIO4070052.1 hypothetical protein [Vibrio vulnificus]